MAAASLCLLSILFTLFISPAGLIPRIKKNGGLKVPAHVPSKRARRKYEEEARGRSRVSKDLRGGAASSYGATRYSSSSLTPSYPSVLEYAGSSGPSSQYGR